jgi:glucan phosphoethanolaminetransferase (alkaline phosphatase superfamily)
MSKECKGDKMLPQRIYKLPVKIAIITLTYLVMFGFAPIVMRFQQVTLTPSLAYFQLGMDSILSFLHAYILFFLLSLNRWTFRLGLPLLFVLSAAANDFSLHYHMNVTEDIVGVLAEPSWEEVYAYLNIFLLLYLLWAVIVSVACVIILSTHIKNPQNKKIAAIFGIFLLMMFIGDDGGAAEQYAPFNILKNMVRYASHGSGFDKKIDISKVAHNMKAVDDALTVVLVIGESSRADHWSLNGYQRETNPLLAKRKNLTSFQDVTSCTALTRSAVPCLLTRKTVREAENEMFALKIHETSVVSVFRALGFDTYWVGVQGTRAFTDSPFLSIMQEGQNYVLLNPYLSPGDAQMDEGAFPYIDQFLAKPEKRKFLVVHTVGNHWTYTSRYPKSFTRFTPVCGESRLAGEGLRLQSAMKECDKVKGALVNSYDNSIIYADFVLDSIMAKLDKKNALMLFVSDHGESLGEKGVYLHGNMKVKEQRHIPMILWASESFARAHPDMMTHIEASRNAPISHDHVFHSLLGCTGVTSEIVDPRLNLCANAIAP